MTREHENNVYGSHQAKEPQYCHFNHKPPDLYKSLWAVNTKNSEESLTNGDSQYKSRSLPAWGKKQRPVSNSVDYDEVYIKTNSSKKPRNRMGNDEAAIIAICRSKSYNLSRIHLEREGIVVYDERTAL